MRLFCQQDGNIKALWNVFYGICLLAELDFLLILEFLLYALEFSDYITWYLQLLVLWLG